MNPRIPRPLWMSGGEINDWLEDASHENGQYFQRCCSCDEDFIGHKRRHICRKCHYEGKARYDAMTPEERAAQDTFIAGEIEEFYRVAKQPPRYRQYIGKMHDRPNLWELNCHLEGLGTKWRATTAKSLGLHLWNPETKECRCVDDQGFVEIPDLPATT